VLCIIEEAVEYRASRLRSRPGRPLKLLWYGHPPITIRSRRDWALAGAGLGDHVHDRGNTMPEFMDGGFPTSQRTWFESCVVDHGAIFSTRVV